ncbi:MAG: damage-inducible protein DinB [Reichenbachiella sp.]
MQSFFREIFEYHHHFNQQFISQIEDKLAELPDRVTYLLSHNINAHLVWNTRILGGSLPAMQEEYPLVTVRELDTKNYQNTLDIIDSRELSESISYNNSKNESFENSLQDILFHVNNHHTHHRGQLISDIRQSGFAPIPSDYIFFKR